MLFEVAISPCICSHLDVLEKEDRIRDSVGFRKCLNAFDICSDGDSCFFVCKTAHVRWNPDERCGFVCVFSFFLNLKRPFQAQR